MAKVGGLMILIIHEGPKRILPGAEVSFARGWSVFSRRAEVYWGWAKVYLPKGAERAEAVVADVYKLQL